MLNVRWLLLFLVFVSAVGCGSKNTSKLLGFWLVQAPYGAMNVEFKEDGSYTGKFVETNESLDVNGKYRAEGSVLYMDAPTITGGEGKAGVPQGRALTMKLTWTSYNAIEVESDGQKFAMIRTGQPGSK